MTERPRITPKDFFLWAGAMIALYVSVFSLISLLFSYIDQVYPDALDYSYDPYSSSVRFYIASLAVLVPLFLILMRLIRKDIERDASRRDIWVRRWALMLTIFIAGATVAGDLIALINTFLGGEITTRFLLKVAIVLLISTGGLLHFLADMWGYWIEHPSYSRWVGWGAGVVVAASIVSGFFLIGSPTQIRMYRFDDQKVSDLQNIQSQILYFWQAKQKMPVTLTDIVDPVNPMSLPVDPQSGANYVYKPGTGTSFSLCATFNAVTQPNSPAERSRAVPVIPGEKGEDLMMSSWYHQAGEVCFDRTIDPERYPPLNKQTK